MNLNVTAGSVGERIVVALVVLGLVVEMLSDNFKATPARPTFTIEECQSVCWGQDTLVKRAESYACECVPVVNNER